MKHRESVVIKVSSAAYLAEDGPNLAPGWVAETIAIWTQFPKRKGILDLTNRNIIDLPEEIFRMRKLEVLLLNNNKVKEIPKDLSKLAEAKLLRSIECQNNQITTVHEDIGKLNTLESVILRQNKLAEVPLCVSKLYQLLYLDLSYNKLKELPSTLGNLLFLERLNLSHNRIRSLPQPLFSLEQLQQLDISYNKIKEISPAIANLSRLTTLYINHNRLEALPLEMGHLIGVEDWKIEGNSFCNQPEIVAEQFYSRFQILKYLRSQIRQHEDLRISLFTEKDCKYNSFFEIIEGETKPVLVGATPEKLILFLTQVSVPDAKTFECLRLCYSYFTTPDELVSLFCMRLHMNTSEKHLKKDQKRVGEIVQTRALDGLEQLMITFNEDNVVFSEQTIRRFDALYQTFGYQTLKPLLLHAAENESLLEHVHSYNMNHIDFAREQRKFRERQQKESSKQEHNLKKFRDKEKRKFVKNIKKREKIDRETERLAFGLSHSSEEKHILSFTPIDIAQEIVRIDSEYFNSIPPRDFLHQSWTKTPENSGITKCINHFNNLSNFVITLIITQTDLKTRLRTVQHLLDIATELLEYGDFLALFAFASAFSGAAVSRLKGTMSLLDERRLITLETLERLVDNSNNYRTYRDMLEIRKAEGHCIPQLALYLRNLTFMEDGNPDYLHDSSDLANIGKYRLIARTINEIEEMKKFGYEGLIDRNEMAEKVILHTYRMDDAEEQYNNSLLCEPRKARIKGHKVNSSAVALRPGKRTKSNNVNRSSLPAAGIKKRSTTTPIQNHRKSFPCKVVALEEC